MAITDLTVLIMTRDEAENLAHLLPPLRAILEREGVEYELVVVDADSPDRTADVAADLGARVLRQHEPGYANALRQGIAACRTAHVLTLDADHSHRPAFVPDLLRAGAGAALVIASRYVPGGSAEVTPFRRFLSRALCLVYGSLLALPVRDLSSGFRLYRRDALLATAPLGQHFDILPEIVAQLHEAGHRIEEVPFHYCPRERGVSKARFLSFLPSYLATLARCLWARGRALDLGRAAPGGGGAQQP